MAKISLGEKLYIDLVKLIATKLFVFANSGYGKSWLIRRIVEQCFGKVPIIIIDPEGEFSTLREKHDFILIGKGTGYDLAPDPKSAGLLAHRLLQERVSAVIDIYELEPAQRDVFVANFSKALVNAPKELWHPYIVIYDEAQDFAPEKGNTLSSGPLLSLAKKGRKRGCCPIFATQRVSDISKSVIAACNNKLIGQASLDIDMKRCAAELGFATKEQMLSMRDLEPGEFFAFGPAISKTVTKVKVGPVFTTHPDSSKMGSKIGVKVSPASEKIKTALSKLADLPQEAAKEMETVKDLKTEVARLNQELRKTSGIKSLREFDVVVDQKSIDRAVVARDKEWMLVLKEAQKMIEMLIDRLMKIAHVTQKIGDLAHMEIKLIEAPKTKTSDGVSPTSRSPVDSGGAYDPARYKAERHSQGSSLPSDVPKGDITGPEQKLLNALAWCESTGMNAPPQELVCFLSGYQHIRSTGYTNPRGYLKSKGLIEYGNGTVNLTNSGRELSEAPETPLDTEQLHRAIMEKLDGPEKKLLQPLLDRYPDAMTNAQLCEVSGYMHERSTGYTNPRGRLKSFGLIEYHAGTVRARDILFIN